MSVAKPAFFNKIVSLRTILLPREIDRKHSGFYGNTI